jgi:hypothetical protein
LPGPVPKPAEQRRRRNSPLANTVKLPAGGRQGPELDWPLDDSTSRERVLWARVWKTPQAAAWERLGWEDVVARYVRALTAAEQRGAPTPILAEVRQLEDRLGLSPMAMLRLRWEIAPDEVAELREDRTPTVHRLRAVDPHAVEGT